MRAPSLQTARAPQHGRILDRIRVVEHQVRAHPGGDTTDVGDPQRLGPVRRGRDHRREWLHTPVDHRDHLVGGVAVRVEWRPGVGRADVAHARTDRSHVTRLRFLDQCLRLCDRVRRCLSLVAGDPHERADRGTAERSALGHLLGDAGRDLDAVLDRVDPGQDRLQDPLGPDRVRGDAPVPRMRLLDRGCELLGGERGERGADPRREHATRRDELDRERARADLLANGAADRVGPIDLARDPDVVAMPAGDRQRGTGRDHSRARHDPGLDRAGEVDDPDPPEVPDGGDAVGEMLARVHRPLDRPERGRQPCCLAGEVGTAVEAQMDMTIDQSRGQRPAWTAHLPSGARFARGPRMRTGPRDAVEVHEDPLVRSHPRPVEHGDVGEVGARHVIAPTAARSPSRPRGSVSCRQASRR